MVKAAVLYTEDMGVQVPPGGLKFIINQFQRDMYIYVGIFVYNGFFLIVYVIHRRQFMKNPFSYAFGAWWLLTMPLQAQQKEIFVEKVTNSVVIGPVAGNRGLEFGVKNILEEFLLEKEYNLNPKSPARLKVEIIFLDVLTTKKNVSVFHSNAETVVIRLRGTMVVNGKKGKPVVVEESSSEISMSTLLIDEGGKFNQTSLSNALKKSCESLINKLSE